MILSFNVTLSWGSPQEGNYSDVVEAENEGAALRALAEEMADHSDGPELDTDEEREEWILDRVNGFHDVYPVSAQLEQDLATMFAQELFNGAAARQINLVALGKLLAENSERVLTAA